MSKAIAIVGYGPGVARAVSERFGMAGFTVGLIARTTRHTAAGVADLTARGIDAAAFQADAGSPAELRTALCRLRQRLGPVSVLLWNAHGGREAGDIAVSDPSLVAKVFDVAVVGLLGAVQELLGDLKAAGDGAVLVTNGAMADPAPAVDRWAVGTGAAGVALANAAKAKLVGLLSERLRGEGVYVGEVTIVGAVKGTPTGDETSIDPAAIAERFWQLYEARNDARARVTDPRFA